MTTPTRQNTTAEQAETPAGEQTTAEQAASTSQPAADEQFPNELQLEAILTDTALRKTPREWIVTLEVSSEKAPCGAPVMATANVIGDAPGPLAFNFGWSNDETWWSTYRGSETLMAGDSHTFTFEKGGDYRIFVDVFDAEGRTSTAFASHKAKQDYSLTRPPLPGPDAETVIDVHDVSMIFNIASEQFNSLKEYFLALSRHELKFKEFRALDHISFEVKRGEAFGLVGTNGSGKSTMLKIIAGVLEASEGSCTVTGTIAPLIELGAGFDMELTAKENIYLNGALLGYRKEFIDEHFDDIVSFAELENFMDMPLKNYSSGMVARIAFAVATITEPDILIVDETLSVGDFLFQRKCEKRIRELVDADGVTVLLVSHSIDLVERMCDRVCWIEKGKQRMLGPTDDVVAAYKALG